MLGEQLVDLSDARPASERSAMESLHLRQHLGSHMNRCQNQNPHQPTNGLQDEQIDSSNGPNFSLTFSFCITFSFIFLCRRWWTPGPFRWAIHWSASKRQKALAGRFALHKMFTWHCFFILASKIQRCVKQKHFLASESSFTSSSSSAANSSMAGGLRLPPSKYNYTWWDLGFYAQPSLYL